MNKNYLITGGSSGIGYEISKLLLDRGDRVFIISRSAEECDLKDLEEAFVKNIDIRSVEQIKMAKRWISEELKSRKLDGIINSAGIGKAIKLKNTSEKEYEDFFDTNVKGTIFTVRLFLPLLKTKSGVIINFSSIAGIKGFAEWSLYASTKFAVEGFSQSIRYELRNSGIRVSTIRAGSVDTPFYSYLPKSEKAAFIKPKTIADFVVNILDLPPKTTIENIFINNSIGDI